MVFDKMSFRRLKKKKVNGVTWVRCENEQDFNAFVLYYKELEYAAYTGLGWRGKNWYFAAIDDQNNCPRIYDFTLSEVKNEYAKALDELETIDVIGGNNEY